MSKVYTYSHCKVFSHKVLNTLPYNTTVLGLLIEHIDKGGQGLFGGKY